MDIASIKLEELGKGSPISTKKLKDITALSFQMAMDIYEVIKENNEKNQHTVLILPVGPTAQYPILTELINRTKLSLKNVYIFNMDEYLDENMELIPEEHFLSFRGFMNREFYGKIDPELNVPEENRYFPMPDDNGFYWNKIRELGGVDACFGGIGINGHVAFNEPPEPDEAMTIEEFSSLPTRIVKLSREVRVTNAILEMSGYYQGMPTHCVTIGMREILCARKIRLYVMRKWHRGVLRHVLHGPPTPSIPASLLQNHPDVTIYYTENVAKIPYEE